MMLLNLIAVILCAFDMGMFWILIKVAKEFKEEEYVPTFKRRFIIMLVLGILNFGVLVVDYYLVIKQERTEIVKTN